MEVVLTKIDEARKLLSRSINFKIEGTEKLRVQDSFDRVSSKTIKSKFNLPQTKNSAVDGFAISLKDILNNEKQRFDIIGMAKAGHPFLNKVSKNQTVEIYTGAIMPKGLDCVVMHENTERIDDHILIKKVPKKGLNVRPAGENVKINEIIITKGKKINSPDIGQLAASGNNEIEVFKKLNVSIFSTGDEVIDSSGKLEKGQIFDANRPMLFSMLNNKNLNLIDDDIVEDKLSALTKKYENSLQSSDVVISSGGASDGIEDHTQKALKNIGAKLIFWQLAIKPGKPMAIAKHNKTLIFCLPGNPVAAYVCTQLLIKPAIEKISGSNFKKPFYVFLPSGFEHEKKIGRTEFLRCKIVTKDNTSKIFIHGRRGAGVISSLTGADGLVEIPDEVSSVKENQLLKFLPFSHQAL
tara:strand:- start:505 stop:1734 length:1230 start_codon:yes stop_codon:yes gene_type:complete